MNHDRIFKWEMENGRTPRSEKSNQDSDSSDDSWKPLSRSQTATPTSTTFAQQSSKPPSGVRHRRTVRPLTPSDSDSCRPNSAPTDSGLSTPTRYGRRIAGVKGRRSNEYRNLMAADGYGWFSVAPWSHSQYPPWYPVQAPHCCGHHTPEAAPCSQNEEIEEMRDKIRILEADKQNLLLQVNVLTEQIDVQTDKLQDLEAELQTKKKQLNNSEDMLQQEIMSRASMENSRLELLTEISSLRLQLASSEQKRLNCEEKCKKLENELLNRPCISSRSTEMLCSPSAFSLSARHSPEPYSEIAKLRKTLESVTEANQEKEKKISELRTAVSRYKNLQDVLLGETSKSSDKSNRELRTSHDSLFPNSNAVIKKSDFDLYSFNKPPLSPRALEPSTFPGSAFRPSPHKDTLSQSSSGLNRPYSKTPPPRFYSSSFSRPQSFEISSNILFHSKQPSFSSSNAGTPQPSNSNTLQPPKQSISYQSLCSSSIDNFNSGPSRRTGFFRRHGVGWFRKGKRSNSTPELAHCETESIYESVPTPTHSLHRASLPSSSCPSPKLKSRRKGIRRLFGRGKQDKHSKLGRQNSNSGLSSGMIDPIEQKKEKLSPKRIGVPFSHWDADSVAEWMDQIGLGMYHNECKKWVKNGDQLLKATNTNLEKELKMKNGLHRKKLRLALQSIGSECGSDPSEQLDYHWVVGWLDDIGLPQYKDVFAEARIDGRVLNYLTVEDMITLKVTSLLHFLSVKRGIQVLRKHKFDPSCLIRRSNPEETPPFTADVIELWTNHRVMEWLKTVDLSEYAPNLRGSGIHGALMVYENGFNADLLASLLNIPSGKTLLRRHLALRFKELMGNEIMQQKRDSELKPGSLPLTASTKIKAGRRNPFRLSFRNKPIMDLDDFVCPMDLACVFADANFHIPFELNLCTSKEDNQTEASPHTPVTDTSV